MIKQGENMALSKNIEWTLDYDVNGHSILKVWKKKGKISLDELQQVACKWSEGDLFAWVFRGVDPDCDDNIGEIAEPTSSDYVELYIDADKFVNALDENKKLLQRIEQLENDLESLKSEHQTLLDAILE